jgi:parallel beta-helix repeat protein
MCLGTCYSKIENNIIAENDNIGIYVKNRSLLKIYYNKVIF